MVGGWGRREGSSGCEIYADVFESVPFSRFFFILLLPFPSFFPSSPLTVGAVCGWRGVGWISRKGGWDAQTEGEKGEVQSSLTLRRTVMADSGGVGLEGIGGRWGGAEEVHWDKVPCRDFSKLLGVLLFFSFFVFYSLHLRDIDRQAQMAA